MCFRNYASDFHLVEMYESVLIDFPGEFACFRFHNIVGSVPCAASKVIIVSVIKKKTDAANVSLEVEKVF